MITPATAWNCPRGRIRSSADPGRERRPALLRVYEVPIRGKVTKIPPTRRKSGELDGHGAGGSGATRASHGPWRGNLNPYPPGVSSRISRNGPDRRRKV